MRLSLRGAVLGSLISGACVVILLRNVELADSWQILAQVSGRLLLLPVAITLVNLVLRAARWQRLFPSEARPSLLSAFQVLAIGNMANNLLPGRAGDLSRCVLIGRRTSLANASLAFATVAVEKILDGLALVGVVLSAVWLLSPPQWVSRMAIGSAILFALAAILGLWLRHRPGLFLRVARRIFGSRGESLLAACAEGLHVLGSPAHALAPVVITAAVWATEAGLVWAIALSLGVRIAPLSALVVAAVLGLGFMIPAAPAGLGTYELFGVAAFKLVGVAAGGALAVTALLHVWVFVANNALGLLCVAWAGIGWSQLRTAAEPQAATASAGHR